jgi:hypothetical protein
MPLAYPDSANTLFPSDMILSLVFPLCKHIPRFGVGSRSWAGREKRTAARSDTPMNLPCPSSVFDLKSCFSYRLRGYYLLSTPKKVFNLELSSGGFSAGAFDVAAKVGGGAFAMGGRQRVWGVLG